MIRLKLAFQKFEGDIEKENAESLAADIAEFLNSRKNRLRSATVTEPVRAWEKWLFGKWMKEKKNKNIS